MTVDNQQQTTMVRPASSSWVGAVASILNPWNNMISLAQRACFTVLAGMKVGHVRIIITRPGTTVTSTHDYGDLSSKLSATVTVRKDSFWPRLALYGALGFGEAYMYEEIEVDHLTALLLIFIRNRDHFVEMNLLPSGLNKLINTVIHSPIPNTIYNALNNIQAHYDLGNEMFASFLDPTMTYSCPIWKTVGGKEDEDDFA
ncbi:hypothetical protein HDU67_001446, partial [Dinochytrium kinnereticum]